MKSTDTDYPFQLETWVCPECLAPFRNVPHQCVESPPEHTYDDDRRNHRYRGFV